MSVRNSEAPVGWSETAIETLLAPLEDGRVLHQGWSPQCEKGPSPSDDKWGVLKTTAIQPGAFHPEHNKLLPSHLPPRPQLEVKEGDILITCAGPRARCGVACLVRNTRGRLMISGKMYRFRAASDRVDPRYLEAFLQTNEAAALIEKMKTGTSDSGLNLTHARFRRLPVRVAPLNEQRRIVEEIDKQLTRLEAAVVALKRVQANLKRYRAAVLKAACEGRLVPTEAELAKKECRAYESADKLLDHILTERREKWAGRGKYSEPAPAVSGVLPSAPEGWTEASLEQLTSANRVICYGILMPKEHVPDGVPYVKVRDLKGDKIDFASLPRTAPEIAAKYARASLKPGDVLLAIRGTYGRVAEVPSELDGGNITQDTARLAFTTLVDRHYLAWFLRSEDAQNYFKRVARGVAVKGVNIGDVRPCPILLPPLLEQSRIVAEVERLLSVVDEQEAVVSANLQRAIRLRQSVLQRAFTGQLVDYESTNPVKLNAQTALAKRPNRHFARALLSAEIVHQLHTEPTFGRVKHQKIFHLCEHIAQITEIEGEYHREAAGPLDNKLIYANETELKKQDWYATVKRSSYGHAYQPLKKAGTHLRYMERYWPHKIGAIRKLIEQMRGWDTDRCEIFSTTYAAWNDLLLWGHEATEETIVHEILNRWHDSKRRISEKRWRSAIAWIKKEGFAPTGFGKPTCSLENA